MPSALAKPKSAAIRLRSKLPYWSSISRIGRGGGQLGDAVHDPARIAPAEHDRGGAAQYIYPLKRIRVGNKSAEIKPCRRLVQIIPEIGGGLDIEAAHAQILEACVH